MAKKIGEKSCQSNLDTRASDFGPFLVIELLLYVLSLYISLSSSTIFLNSSGSKFKQCIAMFNGLSLFQKHEEQRNRQKSIICVGG